MKKKSKIMYRRYKEMVLKPFQLKPCEHVCFIERKEIIFRPSRSKLQKLHNGDWIQVAQLDSSNPDDWFYNDPYLKDRDNPEYND